MNNMTDELSYILDTRIVQQTGRIHKNRNIKIQDVSYIGEQDHIAIFGLTDGQGATDLCSVSGKEVMNTVAEYIWSMGVDALSAFRYYDELQYELIRRIRQKIDELTAEHHLDDNSELSSTLLMIAIDNLNGRYVSVHIGDGVAIGVKKDGSTVTLSCPDNGITSRYTWFTTSSTAMQHLRINFGSVKDYKRLLLATDGVVSLGNGSYIRPGTRTVVTEGELNCVVTYMEQDTPVDDASLIVIDIGERSMSGFI